jgi:acetyl esterase/lipase
MRESGALAIDRSRRLTRAQVSGRRRVVVRSLTTLALVLAVAALGLAYCMVVPVRWDGAGKLGAIALFFPLHLLLVSALAGILWLVARGMRARLAARAFALVVIATSAMALVPTLAVWRRARELDVALSLDDYLANARRLNMGLPQAERSVVYGTAADGTKLELDVWRSGLPDVGPLRPAVVVVHGGSWNHGNRGMLPDWNGWLNGLGYEVFDVEYRMPPPVRWLDEVGDVKSALAWLATNAHEYHVDPTRISLMGSSAGGNLSMLAAYGIGDPRLPSSTGGRPVAVRAVINFYGPSDLALLYATCKSPDYVRPLMSSYIGGTPDEQPERYRLLSPLEHVGPRSPPTLTLIGTSDRLVSVEQAARLDAALEKARVPHETDFLPGNDHGFDTNWGGFGTQIARARVKSFLEEHDAPSPTKAVVSGSD